MDGIVTQMTRNEEVVGLPGQLPIRIGVKLTADDGIYPTGLLLTEDGSNTHFPLEVVTAEVIATGDGAATEFSGTLAAALPVEPGSLVIADDTETFVDDGCGRLVGDAGGTGTINYQTAAYTVTPNAVTADTVDVTADYITAVDGVLDVEVDTSRVDAGVAVVLGRVAQDVLKIGAVTKAAPTVALIRAMRKQLLFVA